MSYIDFLFETSLLGATTDSGEYRTFLNDCPILGFPRNDILFKNDNHKFLDWLDKNVSVKYKKIVVYAPTYRDYPGAYSNKNVLGFDDPNNELESFLEANDILLVVKYHPLQETSNTLLSPHVVLYEKTYDYSLYDALSVCDLLISDYSSVIHDFMITGKPVVLDFFDYEKYDSSRGFAFEPIDYIMPCKPCKDFRELSSAIKEGLSSESRGEQYFTVQKMFHWHIDNHSTERVFDFLKNYIK